MKAITLINVDCKPNFTRIPKDTIVEIMQEMPNNYTMVVYNGGYYPVPNSSIKKLDDKNETSNI